MVNEKQTGRVTAVEKEKTKLRERQRRAITSRILGGLRKHGGYNLPPRADINDVIKALATEAGWIVHPDGTTYRSKLGASESRIHGRHINPSMQPALLVADSTCMENGGGNADQCSSSVVEMGHGVGGFVHCWQLGHEYPIQLAIAERDQCNDGFVFGPRNGVPNAPTPCQWYQSTLSKHSVRATSIKAQFQRIVSEHSVRATSIRA